MELKVWVEGIERIVCGVTEKTTCQDVVYALAHATGKTGRFTLIERWRNNERLLAPQDHPVKVLQKWGEHSQDVQFILQRSGLDSAPKTNSAAARGHQGVGPRKASSGAVSPPMNFQWGNGARPPAVTRPTEHAAVWKLPPSAHPGSALPPTSASYPVRKVPFQINGNSEANARLSPDSGRGSDKTGSDTSNDNKDNSKNKKIPPPSSSHQTALTNGCNNFQRSSSASQAMWRSASGVAPDECLYGFAKQTSMPAMKQTGTMHPPAYKPPPLPYSAPSSSSPSDPPPYRDPPPAPAPKIKPSLPPSPSAGRRHDGASPAPGSHQTVRPPRYSPPPTHRVSHLSRHPSKTSLLGSGGGQPSGSHDQRSNPRQAGRRTRPAASHSPGSQTDIQELLTLVTAQQSTLQIQQADIRQFEAEEAGFVDCGTSETSQSHGVVERLSRNDFQPCSQPLLSPGSQLDLVLSEVRRLEELSLRNDDELTFLNSERARMDREDDGNIRTEILQLKQRLAGTDVELQKTNTTLRRLGNEMRHMSLEKSRQKEQELVQEVERLQGEIKTLQKTSEDSANISQQLNKDVKEVEDQIRQRKSEVELLIKEMREANMESLIISPPEESKQCFDGTSRKMLGSPRQLETAVPTSKNPHGVWV